MSKHKTRVVKSDGSVITEADCICPMGSDHTQISGGGK